MATVPNNLAQVGPALTLPRTVPGIIAAPVNGIGDNGGLTVDHVSGNGSNDTSFTINETDPAEIKGTRIGNGKYKILSLLGKGGMAAVYLARDDNEKLYAIKVISPRFVGPSEWNRISDRFNREVKILQDLTQEGNPNIVKAVESGSEDTPTLKYLVMEYIKGGTLQSNAHLPLPQKLEILASVCDALADIYSKSEERRIIIHRDLKPANIFLTHLGKPMIGDFGIAFNADDENRLTKTGDVLGTVAYVSPEQAKGQKELKPASDLFAVGIMLYEIATGGVNPFPGQTKLEQLNRRNTQPTRPSLVIKDLNKKTTTATIPQIDSRLEALIMKLLSLNPRDRVYGDSDDPGDDARNVAKELRTISQRLKITNSTNLIPETLPLRGVTTINFGKAS